MASLFRASGTTTSSSRAGSLTQTALSTKDKLEECLDKDREFTDTPTSLLTEDSGITI